MSEPLPAEPRNDAVARLFPSAQLTRPIHDVSDVLASHDRRVRAEAGEEGYRAAISDLRWLADRRDEYGGPRKVENVTDYFALSDTEKRIYDAVKDVHHTADILAGDNDGCGWLPSWRWDEWERRKSARAEADRAEHTPNDEHPTGRSTT